MEVPRAISSSIVFRGPTITTHKEFPDRSHYTLGQAGWEEVADYALDWATEQAAPAQTDAAPELTLSAA